MKWIVIFGVGKVKSKKSKKFEKFGDANKYAKNLCIDIFEKYENKYRVVVKVISLKQDKIHIHIWNIDLTYEYKLKDYAKKISMEKALEKAKLAPIKSKKRDFQRSKVYKWEQKLFTKYGMFESKLEERQVILFISKVFLDEKKPSIPVYFKAGGSACYFSYAYDDVSLTFTSSWGLNKIVLLHEISHYLVFLDKIEEGGHSEHFVGKYIYLLSKYLKIDKESLWSSAEKNKIKFIKI
jgi:hypothetical protein